MNTKRSLGAIAAAAAAALLLAGCSSGGGSDNGSGEPTNVNSDLPESVQQSGVIRIGAAVGFPPYQYFDDDGSTVIGYEPDLIATVGDALGVKTQFENTSFASLFTSLKTGRFDMAMNGLTITDERMVENDMIAYAKDGYGLVVKKGDSRSIAEASDLCGMTISVLRGSTAEAWMEERNTAECAGDAVNVLAFDEGSQALLAVESGQADATSAQTAQLLFYELSDPERYEFVQGFSYGDGFVGIAVPKGQDAFVQLLVDGLQQTIDDGSYAEVMKEWNLEPLMVDEVELNPSIS